MTGSTPMLRGTPTGVASDGQFEDEQPTGRSIRDARAARKHADAAVESAREAALHAGIAQRRAAELLVAMRGRDAASQERIEASSCRMVRPPKGRANERALNGGL